MAANPPPEPLPDDADRYGDDFEDGVIEGWLSPETLAELGFAPVPPENADPPAL